MKRYSVLFPPVFFLPLLTLLLTYPLPLHLSTYVADTGDPLLNTWAIAWGQHALLHPWQSVADLFDTNAFYPYRQTLGFSENLLLYAALTLPLPAFQLGPVFAHNGAILFSLALAGWGMALLVTHWTGDRRAGLVAGVIFAFIPARLNHWAHIHQLSIQWLPFLILYLDRWLTRGRRRDLILFGLFLNLQLFSVINYVPQTSMLVALLLGLRLAHWAVQWSRHARRPASPTPNLPPLRKIIFGGVLLLTLTAVAYWPIAGVYFDLSELYGFERSLATPVSTAQPCSITPSPPRRICSTATGSPPGWPLRPAP